MLVLARKLGERIFIGEDITIEVMDIDRGKVRLGITAPLVVPIDREEVARRRAAAARATAACPSPRVEAPPCPAH